MRAGEERRGPSHKGHFFPSRAYGTLFLFLSIGGYFLIGVCYGKIVRLSGLERAVGNSEYENDEVIQKMKRGFLHECFAVEQTSNW